MSQPCRIRRCVRLSATTRPCCFCHPSLLSSSKSCLLSRRQPSCESAREHAVNTHIQLPMTTRNAVQDSTEEPIYMTPSELAQGHKHGAPDHLHDFDAQSATSGEGGGGGLNRQQAQLNHLRRTRALQQKLDDWETKSEHSGEAGAPHTTQRQLNSTVMCSESGVVIEEMHEQGEPSATEQTAGDGAVALLRPGEMSLALHSSNATRTAEANSALTRPSRTNTMLVAVPQQEAWVVERFGKFNRILEPGMSILIPLVDRIKYVHCLKQLPYNMTAIQAITQDQVAVSVDAMLFLKVVDPFKASYAVENAEFAVINLATTSIRVELSRTLLDNVFSVRSQLCQAIDKAINSTTDAWGIQCVRCEIRDLQIPYNIQRALVAQAEAERNKRTALIEADGVRLAEMRVADAQKYSVLSASEAARVERVERAEAEAEAMLALARARAQSVALLSEAISLPNGMSAAALSVAEQYVSALAGMARAGNTLVLPSDVATNPGAMLSQAMSIFGAANSAAAAASAAGVNQQLPAAAGGKGAGHLRGEGAAESIADSMLTESVATRSNYKLADV